MAVMTTIAIASLAIGAYQTYRAGKAAKKQGEANQAAADSSAELFDFNAAIATTQAKDAVARGAEEESRFRVGVRGQIGAQRAGFAAGNIDVGYGSAADVQADVAYLGELDALTIRNNAAREAWGHKVQAADLTKRGQIARKEGVNLAEAGRVNAQSAYLNGASTLLTGATNLYSAKYGFK